MKDISNLIGQQGRMQLTVDVSSVPECHVRSSLVHANFDVEQSTPLMVDPDGRARGAENQRCRAAGESHPAHPSDGRIIIALCSGLMPAP